MDNTYITTGIIALVSAVMGYVIAKISNDKGEECSSMDLVCLRDDIRAIASQTQQIIHKLDQTFIFKKKEEVVKKKK